jgi:hypothetical protein
MLDEDIQLRAVVRVARRAGRLEIGRVGIRVGLDGLVEELLGCLVVAL